MKIVLFHRIIPAHTH